MSDPLHSVTPLWHSDPMSQAAGLPIWLKMECFQPVGSFKLRGMGYRSRECVEQGARRLVSSSGGNAGLAIAWAARALGVPATVVVPATTSEFLRDKIRSVGGEVVEHGSAWDDAHRHALTLAAERDHAYVHPFDHPTVWQGHASLVEELASQGPRPGLVVVAVGGGGLLCGVLQGLYRVGWSDIPVLAVETEGAASFRAALEAGRVVTLPAIRSLATTLGALAVTGELLAWTRRHEITSVVVSDRQAVDACLRFAADHRVLVEPACGAALAVVYEAAAELGGRQPVLVVVCGGAGVSVELLSEWERQTR